jgi:site-specific DNA-methyltransferase (adenine-specific)
MTTERHFPEQYLNEVICGNCITEMDKMPENFARLVIADPPYFQVLTDEAWDKQWASYGDYINWSLRWMWSAMRLLMPGGLLYCFGQPGKREHVMLHLMSEATRFWSFHDLIIWDRVVGYNHRGDSFTPAYEMILVLRKAGGEPYFNRDAVREPYPADKISEYAKDKRYKNLDRRMANLQKGKFLTNLWKVPSLKGSSKEKAGHPAQKPIGVIERIIGCSSAPDDWIIDPFLGSGTTAVVAERWQRKWTGIELSEEYAAAARQRVQKERQLQNQQEPLTTLRLA